MPLPSLHRGGLSTEVVPGKLREEGGVPLTKTAESSAQAIKTCWQREMEKKTNTRWATLLGRKLYLFSFNLINPQRGPHFVDQKRGTQCPHLLTVTAVMGGRAECFTKLHPLPLGSVKAKVGQLPRHAEGHVTSAFELGFQFSMHTELKSPAFLVTASPLPDYSRGSRTRPSPHPSLACPGQAVI